MVNRDLYVFNPTCETAIANGSETFMAPQILREFEAELSLLPMVFASTDDYILSARKPSEGFIQELARIGFPVSNWASKEEIVANKELQFSSIIPWGWSPAVHFQLKEIKKQVCGSFCKSRVFTWHEEHKALYERKTAADLLARFLTEFSSSDYCSFAAVPSVLISEEEIVDYIKRNTNIVLKSPISSSGRGVQMIRDAVFSRSNAQWAGSVLKQSGYLMAEPLHCKKLDFSFQLEIDRSGKVIYHGTVFFFTNSNGSYQGHYLNRKVDELIGKDFSVLLDETGERLRMLLESSIYPKHYEGFLGIDGMVIEEGNRLKVHPCVEINCRLTMGMLALRIEKLIHPDATGSYRMFTGKAGSFLSFTENMKVKHPVVLKDGRFYSGFACLSEPLENGKFGAYLLLAAPC